MTCYICRHTQEVIVKVKRNPIACTCRGREDINKLEEKYIKMNLVGYEDFRASPRHMSRTCSSEHKMVAHHFFCYQSIRKHILNY